MEKKIHIALLDTRVYPEYYASTSLIHQIDFNDTPPSSGVSLNHGTICLGILSQKSLSLGAEIVVSSLEILSEDNVGDTESLISAITWCEQNNVDVVNISLGSTAVHEFQRIREKVNHAYYKHGIIFVCAASNQSKLSYPAALKTVIGVNTRKDMDEDAIEFCFDQDLGIDITACSEHFLSDKLVITKTFCFNSYAAPLVTIMVAKALSCNIEKRSVDDIVSWILKENDTWPKSSEFGFSGHSTNWLYDAAIYDESMSIKPSNYLFSHEYIDAASYLQITESNFQTMIHIKNDGKSFADIELYRIENNSMKQFIWKPRFASQSMLSETTAFVISITMDVIIGSSCLISILSMISVLFQDCGYNVVSISHDPRNLMCGGGYILKGTIFSDDIDIKLQNNMVELILLGEDYSGADLKIKITQLTAIEVLIAFADENGNKIVKTNFNNIAAEIYNFILNNS